MAFGDPTSTQAKTGYGFKFFYDPQGSPDVSSVTEWTHIEGMKSGSLPSPDKPEIDVTTTTDDVKAYIPGIGSINDISLEFNFYPQNAVHRDLMENVLYDDTPRPWKIEGQGMVFIFMGYLKSANVSFGVDQALSMPLTLKVTTRPAVTFLEVDDVAPTITNVAAPTGGPAFTTGQEMSLVATFSEPVIVEGKPFIIATIGSAARNFVYKTGSGTEALTFSYTPVEGDSAEAGQVKVSQSINSGGGRIKDTYGNSAVLTFTSPDTASITVNAA